MAQGVGEAAQEEQGQLKPPTHFRAERVASSGLVGQEGTCPGGDFAIRWLECYWPDTADARQATRMRKSCGGRNRTADLELMRLTSYFCSTPQ
jgi:hypothetical protein